MQDESVQLRPINDALIAQQKIDMEQFKIDSVKKEERAKSLESLKPVDNVFSRPVRKIDSELIDKLTAKENADRAASKQLEQGFEVDAGVPVPASLYQELNGKTVVRALLGIEKDSPETLYLNNYVLQKMRAGKMQDTKENFEKVFNRLLARNDLGRNQRPDYIIQKLHLYLSKKDVDEEDDLVRSLISKHRGRRNGIRR